MTHISALPTPPNRSDSPTTFSSRADAFLGALPTFVAEANALSDEVNALRDATESDKLATDGIKADTQDIYDSAVADTTAIKAQTQAIYDSAVADTQAIAAQAVSDCGDIRDACQLRLDDCQTFRDQSSDYRDAAYAIAAAMGEEAALPDLVGKANKMLMVNDAEDGVHWGLTQVRLPIFSADAADRLQVTVLEDLTSGCTYATGMGCQVNDVIVVDDLLVALPQSGGYAASSADGETWTLRAMPSAGRWNAVSDGTRALAWGPGVAVTTDGITWTTATNIPSVPGSSVRPAVIGNSWLIADSSTAGQYYVSTDFGATWSAQTGPITPVAVMAVGGLFCVFPMNGPTYYTSATGLTGSWTARTMPNSLTTYPCLLPDGTIHSSGHVSADGLTWDQLTTSSDPNAYRRVCKIYGVHGHLNTTFGLSWTFHGGSLVLRTSGHAGISYATSAANTAATSVPLDDAAGRVLTIRADGSNAQTALFE